MLLDPDDADDGPAYAGSYVTLRRDGCLYTVAVEPPLLSGAGAPQLFASKQGAWSAARELWLEHRLPFTDYSDGLVGISRKKSDE